jgi:cytochrome P450 family 4
MGVEIHAQDNPNQEYVRAVQRMSDFIFERFFTVLRQFPALFKFSALAKKQAKELKILHEFTTSVIINRKNQLERDFGKTQLNEKKKKMNFLDVLLHSSLNGRSLTNLEIREQVDTFMFEVSTVASVIFFHRHCYFFLLL